MLKFQDERLPRLPKKLDSYFPRLEELYVENAQLQELPKSIGKLHNLRIVSLKANRLTALPPSLADLISLECLDISGNNFSHIPLEITLLTRLTRLNASFNSITGLATALPRSLSHIVLSHNQISAIPSGSIFPGVVDLELN